MQHVECNKCVFISSRLIYSLLAWRRERRTTRNELDVSDHTVFLLLFFSQYDPFYDYIVTVFVSFWLACVFVHPVSSKAKSLWCRTKGTKCKNRMEAWNCRWALWGLWRDRDHYPLHKASTNDKDGGKILFCVLRWKCVSKKPLVRCVCFCHWLWERWGLF